MTDSDTLLLQRFCKTRDPEAFSEIVKLYAGVVYGACRRILNDSDLASDVAQETFFHLFRNAGKVTGSLAGWLHTVATRKAIDLIRKDSARKTRELEYSDNKLANADTWEDVSPFIDEALGQVDDQLRQVLVKHYLEGLTTHQIAERLNCSQATVSRKISAGLTSLRSVLKKRGIVIAAISLSSLMAQNTVQAAPAALAAELGKMSLASAATTAATAIKVKVIAAVAIAVIGTGSVVTYNTVTRQKGPEIPVSETTRADEDKSFAGNAASQGSQSAEQGSKSLEKPATEPASTTASGGWKAVGGMRVAAKPQPADPNEQAQPAKPAKKRSFGGGRVMGGGIRGRGMMGGRTNGGKPSGMMGGSKSSE